MSQKDTLIAALLKEISLQKSFLKDAEIETIYFGGGTPSILSTSEIQAILNSIANYHTIAADPEITLEANPDDLSKNKLRELYDCGVNRLSIGIQSFHDIDLKWMNRSHTAEEAKKCIGDALETGYDDFSVDLIFGSQTTTTQMWAENLETATSMDIPHLSCYGLTIEEGTALHHFIKKGTALKPEEILAAEQFEMTMSVLAQANYEHYEISNYAKASRYSRHNTNYWKQVPYLGIGPAAHSYDGKNRQWNVAHNAKYNAAINENRVPFEIEKLSLKDRFNEYVMTGLRTMWGCKKKELSRLLPEWELILKSELQDLFAQELITTVSDTIVISEKGKLISDSIMSQLFITEELINH